MICNWWIFVCWLWCCRSGLEFVGFCLWLMVEKVSVGL